MPTLTSEQIDQGLAKLDGWSRTGNAIEKTYIFHDFIRGLGFVNTVATAAEAAQHHPDILIKYNQVTMTLSTHSEGGVTEKDFALAGKIEALNL